MVANLCRGHGAWAHGCSVHMQRTSHPRSLGTRGRAGLPQSHTDEKNKQPPDSLWPSWLPQPPGRAQRPTPGAAPGEKALLSSSAPRHSHPTWRPRPDHPGPDSDSGRACASLPTLSPTPSSHEPHRTASCCSSGSQVKTRHNSSALTWWCHILLFPLGRKHKEYILTFNWLFKKSENIHLFLKIKQ